jgi:hypothetical protein
MAAFCTCVRIIYTVAHVAIISVHIYRTSVIKISSQKQSERSGKRSGAGRKTSERERSGERDFRKERGAGAGDRGTGTERRAEVQKIGEARSSILARSRSAHTLW